VKVNPKVSVVIPLKKPNAFLTQSIEHCRRLEYPDFEILVLPDEKGDGCDDGVKCIPTGPVPPSQKRDFALAHLSGDIVAFLDDDAYPQPTWLTNAVRYFADSQVAAVGGPAITAPDDGFAQVASGLVYASRLASGNTTYRHTPQKLIQVDDYPTCNLLVRRDVLERLGGFDTRFWPGEDTKLCLEITKTLGMKILYAPDVVVFHHRRPLFQAHLRQARSYGLHRGYFAKRFPQTSLRLPYFLPSLFLLSIVMGLPLSLAHPVLAGAYTLMWLAYLALLLGTVVPLKNPKLALWVGLGIFLTHIVYGFWFLVGLFSRQLGEETPDEV
jgi:GT2 family glycosyltransferase